MAIDSRNKRASVIGYTLPFGVGPNPDSTLDVQDRAQIVAWYAAENFAATVFASAAETISLPTQSAAVSVQVQVTADQSHAAPTQSAAVEIQVQASGAQDAPSFTQSAAGTVEAAATVTVTGTALGATQSQIAAGGETIVLTITGDTWASGGDFTTAKSAIASGFSGDGLWFLVEAAQVIAGYAGIVRTSDTVITITLPEVSGYSITSDETVTVTVPGSARSDTESDPLDGGTFSVLVAAAASLGGITKKGGKERYPRWIIVGGKRYWVRNAAEEQAVLEAYLSAQRALLEQAEQAAEATGIREEVRKAKIRVTKTVKRIQEIDPEEAWLSKLRAEDEEILSLLH